LDDGPLEQLDLNVEAFSKLPNLRFLKIGCPMVRCEGLSYLPNKLRAIEWFGCPSKSLPMSFSLDKLVELNMPWSGIKEIWKGKKVRSSVLFMQLRVFFFFFFLSFQIS
jgi:hypothetical protein